MSVLIIDYGMGNLLSVQRALEECGVNAFISSEPSDLLHASAIVLPGVGAFSEGMRRLTESGMGDALIDAIDTYSLPTLGICLGMHLLADRGFEGGEVSGLGLISGEVIKMRTLGSERLPHVGWNEITYENKSKVLLKGVPTGTDFYFVHSYCFNASTTESIMATTPYAGGISSIIQKNSVYGVQFHPEKSGKLGFRMLKNFLSLAGLQ